MWLLHLANRTCLTRLSKDRILPVGNFLQGVQYPEEMKFPDFFLTFPDLSRLQLNSYVCPRLFSGSGGMLSQKRTREANLARENSSFIFAACVQSAPRYHFKLAYVVLQMAVKGFFETHF